MNPATPEARRTRAALAEIPARLDRMHVTPLRAADTNQRPAALPAGYLSPAPSPDELVIQQRGRKSMPLHWSPDIELKRNSAFTSLVRTPPKARAAGPLRSTPRKRLMLDERVPLTPEKIDFSDLSTPQKMKVNGPGAPPTKRARIERTVDYEGSIDNALKALSPTQLVGLLRGIMHKHPDIEEEVRAELPTPDLAPLEERLCYLKSNVFKSLPTSRLTSKTDSPAYSRVAVHLAAFKKALIEQGKLLVESQQWDSVIRYVFMAWGYVRATPVWDNQPHNMQRKQCFRALTNFCMSALKKGAFDKLYLADVGDKLQGIVSDTEDVQSCLNYVLAQTQA